MPELQQKSFIESFLRSYIVISLSISRSFIHLFILIISFRFPVHPELRLKWAVSIRRMRPDNKLWEPSKHSVICNEHFKEEDYIHKQRISMLKKGVVPSIFSHSKDDAPKPKRRKLQRTSDTNGESVERQDNFLLRRSIALVNCWICFVLFFKKPLWYFLDILLVLKDKYFIHVRLNCSFLIIIGPWWLHNQAVNWVEVHSVQSSRYIIAEESHNSSFKITGRCPEAPEFEVNFWC